MNLLSIDVLSITRIISHEIIAKTVEADATAKLSNELLEFTTEELDILKSRLKDAITHSSKTFELAFEDKSAGSSYDFVSATDGATNKVFIDASRSLADALADAHFRVKIPGGFCLVGEGLVSGKKRIFFVIKAELQEVFRIRQNKLKVIKNVFLSPAKDFYKVGFFIKEGRAYVPFMYDDQFSLQKQDLTEYFYGQFLGLTTDQNDRLKTKNFFEDAKDFIQRNVDNAHDQFGLLKALNVYYREKTSGIISPKEFADDYLSGTLKNDFERRIISEKYPQAFTRDISLLENRLELQRVSIPVGHNLSLVGNAGDLESVQVIDRPGAEDLKSIEPQINNGRINKMIVLRQV